MRILFVSHYALPHLGGIEVAVDALAGELAARGHQVTHLASDARAAEARLPRGGYRVVRIPAANLFEERAGVPWPIFHPALFAALRREVAAADVVHCHGLLYMSCVAALLVARAHGTPALVSEHVGHVPYASRLLDWTEHVAFGTVGRLSARLADAIVVANERVVTLIAALAPRARVLHIRYGVDQVRYRPAAPGERDEVRRAQGWDQRPRVLFVGRPVVKKGVDLALAAAAAARGAFELVIVGAGDLPPHPHVEQLGELPPERLAVLYRGADAFLLPSRGEGFPLSAQEAMASGLPLVLGDDPGYRVHLAGAGPGARLAAYDAPAITRALLDLLADPRRAEQGAACAAHARAEFSWPRVVDQHLALYQSLISGSAI